MWRYKRGSEVVRGALLQSTLISQPGISGLATARRAAGIMFFPLSQFQRGGQWLLEPMPENALRKALLHTRSVFCIVCSGPVYMVYGVLHNIPLSSIQYIRQNVRIIM